MQAFQVKPCLEPRFVAGEPAGCQEGFSCGLAVGALGYVPREVHLSKHCRGASLREELGSDLD